MRAEYMPVRVGRTCPGHASRKHARWENSSAEDQPPGGPALRNDCVFTTASSPPFRSMSRWDRPGGTGVVGYAIVVMPTANAFR